MKTRVLSVLVLMVAGMCVSATPEVEESRHQQELREHFHHLSYIAEYTCHHPQPRTVPVHELLSPYQTRGKAYFPEYTVLHRCDVFAGCCEGAKKCGPIHADNIHLPFKVTYLEDMGDKHKGEWDMEYFSFDNHTVCGCIDHYGLHYDHEVKDHKDNDDHEHKDHDDHEPKDHYAHDDHEHKDHYAHDDHEAKHHYAHDDHEHKDHYYHDHKDHYDHDDHDHKRPLVSSFKDEYPTIGKDMIRKGSRDEFNTEDEPSKAEKRPEEKANKKIDSLFITI